MYLNTFYVQKSKLLLYPLLKIPFSNIKPNMTFVGINNEISEEEMKLICAYTIDFEEFESYKKEVLLKHPLFTSCFFNDFETQYIVFDLKDYSETFKNFLNGTYSKFPEKDKGLIFDFYSNTKLGTVLIDTHLNPEHYHEFYAEHFNASLETMVGVHETLSPPDMDKEILK